MELKNLILQYQKDTDDYSILELLNLFNPLINKYSYKLNYEDAKNDLTVFFINLMKNIPINSLKDDKFILSYIKKSIHNYYIKCSKLNVQQECNELLDENIENVFYSSDSYSTFFEDLISNLSNREKFILKKLFINLDSINEISNELKISRQAVNQAKTRALSKLKKII